MIGHEIIAYDAIGRISKLLDQLGSGLQSLGLLKVMRAFPKLFLPLFVYTGCISPCDVLEAIIICRAGSIRKRTRHCQELTPIHW